MATETHPSTPGPDGRRPTKGSETTPPKPLSESKGSTPAERSGDRAATKAELVTQATNLTASLSLPPTRDDQMSKAKGVDGDELTKLLRWWRDEVRVRANAQQIAA